MNDGGPAFPVKEYVDAKPGDITWGMHHGMSLRDWFAGMAMLGELSADVNDELKEEIVCQRAWNMADAMLKEKEK